MTAMADFKNVAVIDVHKENINELWPSIIFALKSSSYLAIDVELSGLGSKKLLFARSVEDRYKEMMDVAKTRSVISLGLSCFKHLPESERSENIDCPEKFNQIHFQVQTFNVLLLCSENYIVEPMTLKFLIEHGFDFNKQYAKGISYYRGNDQPDDQTPQSMRQLFKEIIRSGVPIVLHNPLYDLIFIYQSFYANLPASLQTFVADVTEVFTGGIFDTKYIAEYKARMPSSYLEYVFRKCQRENMRRMLSKDFHVAVSCLSYPDDAGVLYLPCALDNKPVEAQDGKKSACFGFSAHGWCPQGNSCPNSHDIDVILDQEDSTMSKKEKKKLKKRKKTEKLSTEDELTEDSDCKMETVLKNNKHASDKMRDSSSNDKCTHLTRKTCGHRAGYDSFMTGFAFATFFSKYGNCNNVESGVHTGLEEQKNKITLSGKDIPLLIQKSNFAKTSKDHKIKIEQIFPTTQRNE